MGSAIRAPSQGSSTWRRGLNAVVAVAAVALAACGPADAPVSPSPSIPESPWAAAAEEYVAALHEASGTGFTNVAQFYAEDADIDWRGLLGYRVRAGHASPKSFVTSCSRSGRRQIPGIASR